MIVNLRGTHGSGKSTIARTVMGKYPEHKEINLHTKRRPLGYVCKRFDNLKKPDLFIAGHYETPCGGCDTILVVNDAFALIQKYAKAKYDVLFEGVLSQRNPGRLLALHNSFPFFTIVIDIPDSECIAAVQTRRAEKGLKPLINTDNLIKEARTVIRGAEKLKQAGANVEFHSRQGALDRTLELLQWS